MSNLSSTILNGLLKVPALLIAGGIWFLSSQQILPKPKGILGFDKLQHLIAYLALAAVAAWWFPLKQRREHPLRTLLALVCIASVYGAVDEVHQYFVPGRDCNVWDWIADTLGAVLGAVLGTIAGRGKLAAASGFPLSLFSRCHSSKDKNPKDRG
jgi:VanZ family protein